MELILDTGNIEEIKEYASCYIGTFKGECINQNQEMVAQGIYHQYLDKKFFELGE